MHDCPTCKVPLHGHEEVCPSCGTKQYVKPEYRHSNLPKPPGVNPAPFIICAIAVLVIGVIAASNSWIGQAIMHPQPPADPIDSMTMASARQAIEQQLTQGLTAVGAPAKLTYKSGGNEATVAATTPVELTVDTTLKDPNQHKAVVDPIKQYMAKAQVTTLVMNDSKSHATWTYNVSPEAAATDSQADQPEQAQTPDRSQSQ